MITRDRTAGESLGSVATNACPNARGFAGRDSVYQPGGQLGRRGRHDQVQQPLGRDFVAGTKLDELARGVDAVLRFGQFLVLDRREHRRRDFVAKAVQSLVTPRAHQPHELRPAVGVSSIVSFVRRFAGRGAVNAARSCFGPATRHAAQNGFIHVRLAADERGEKSADGFGRAAPSPVLRDSLADTKDGVNGRNLARSDHGLQERLGVLRSRRRGRISQPYVIRGDSAAKRFRNRDAGLVSRGLIGQAQQGCQAYLGIGIPQQIGSESPSNRSASPAIPGPRYGERPPMDA